MCIGDDLRIAGCKDCCSILHENSSYVNLAAWKGLQLVLAMMGFGVVNRPFTPG